MHPPPSGPYTANAAPCCKALAARPPCCSTSWIFSAIAAPPQQALGATSCCSTPTASPWGRQAVAAAVATCVGPMPPHTQALATLAPHVVTPLPVGLHRPTLWPPCPPPGGPGCPKGQARRAVLLAGAQGGALLAFWPPGGGRGGSFGLGASGGAAAWPGPPRRVPCSALLAAGACMGPTWQCANGGSNTPTLAWHTPCPDGRP